jgi:deoxyribonuclease-4
MTANRQRLGAHTSIAGGVAASIPRTLSIGANAAQIFVKNNKQWEAPPLDPEEIRAFRSAADREDIFVCAHTGYLINPGATTSDTLEKSFRSLVCELERTTALGLPFTVLHPGNHGGTGEEEGLERIARTLDRAIAATAKSPVRIALETTAGQGTSLGWKFEHLAWLLGRVRKPERFGVCLDTAHVFAAGYDLREEAGYRALWKEFDRIIGLDQLLLIHCNDSKVPLGKRVDRHEHLGRGCIGEEAFRLLMRDRKLAAVPKILETPKSEDLHEDRENLGLLRIWSGRAG